MAWDAQTALRRPRIRARPKALKWADVRNQGIAKAVALWTAILEYEKGRTLLLLEKLGARRGRAHLEAMLRRWSHKTLIQHARNAGKFLEWTRRCTEFRNENPEDAAVLKLAGYMQHLRDAL